MYYRLMATRKKAKKTQNELAEKLNIHRVTYGLKERQEMDFTISEAKLLGEELGVPWTELFDEL
ncbi:helix-turn-helix transcriptional regulator [Lysinibacillus sphaericus]|uniref:helix-turn-helix transcriptional regulator n=1 Tax=Lysinibacillus sphaericus TaxID=1421 RepID=UPI002FBEF779